MKALVTGGSGYVGIELVRTLLKAGHKVRVIDIWKADDIPNGVEFIHGDVRDKLVVKKACEDIDIVYHTVSVVPIAKNKDLFWSVNVGGARSVFECALEENVEKVVYVSTSAVFGRCKSPITDETIPDPVEEYGRTKLEAEKVAEEYSNKGLDISIVRPRTVIGKERLGIFSILFDWVKSGTKIPVLGDGNNIYQFIHVSDLADACILAGNKKGFSAYNIGAEKFGTVRELMEDLIKHAGTKSKVISFPIGLTKACMMVTGSLGLSPLSDWHALVYSKDYYMDISKPKRELSWSPRFSNAEMICESYDYYCEHIDEIQKQNGKKSIHRRPLSQGILKLLKWALK